MGATLVPASGGIPEVAHISAAVVRGSAEGASGEEPRDRGTYTSLAPAFDRLLDRLLRRGRLRVDFGFAFRRPSVYFRLALLPEFVELVQIETCGRER